MELAVKGADGDGIVVTEGADATLRGVTSSDHKGAGLVADGAAAVAVSPGAAPASFSGNGGVGLDLRDVANVTIGGHVAGAVRPKQAASAVAKTWRPPLAVQVENNKSGGLQLVLSKTLPDAAEATLDGVLLRGNGGFQLRVAGPAALTVNHSALLGGEDTTKAVGVLIDKSDTADVGTLDLGIDLAIAGLGGAGVLGHGQMTLKVASLVAGNGRGGLWLEDPGLSAILASQAEVVANSAVGVVASNKAAVAIEGARIAGTTAAVEGIGEGLVADGVTALWEAQVTIEGAVLANHGRAGLVIAAYDDKVSVNKTSLTGNVVGALIDLNGVKPAGLADNDFKNNIVDITGPMGALHAGKQGTAPAYKGFFAGDKAYAADPQCPLTNLGKPCDDGRVCNGAKDVCGVSLQCVGTVQPKLACADADKPFGDCTVFSCAPSGACKPGKAPDHTNCNDGHQCTASTRCKDGKCQGGTFVCGCIPPEMLYSDVANKTKATTEQAQKWWSMKDIAKKPCKEWVTTSNACSGRYYCDTSQGVGRKAAFWQCKPIPGTDTYAPGKQKCTPTANPCLLNACDKDIHSPTAGQCVVTPKKPKSPCNDGDPCTDNDNCDGQGTCVGPIDQCPCRPSNAKIKCAYLVGDNACAGVFCDTSKGAPKHQCKILPSAVVNCDQTDDTFCRTNVCDPKTGVCGLKPVRKLPPGKLVPTLGKVCDDGDKCTASETCFGGVCGAPDPVKAAALKADANPKNDNDPTGGQGTVICKCQSDADCATGDDGDPCNGTMYCDKSGASNRCRANPASVVACTSALQTHCLRDICHPKTGKCALTPTENILKIIFLSAAGKPPRIKHVPYPYAVYDFVGCSDGDPCTVNDHCSAGTCAPGKTNICGCGKDADCADDGDFCNGKPFCDKKAGKCMNNPAELVKCDPAPNTQCMRNSCDKKTGKCALKPLAGVNAPCSDGSPCTVGDVCAAGVCTPGTDVCSCHKDADCTQWDDGNPCNGTPWCDKSKPPYVCRTKPGTAVDCSVNKKPAGSCLESKCDPATGKCADVTKVGACKDDGNPCTLERCGADGKKCVSEPAPDGALVAVKGSRWHQCVGGKARQAPWRMTWIPAGTMRMGCSLKPEGGASAQGAQAAKDEAAQCQARKDERPQHAVAMSGFWIDRLEVTVSEYGECIKAGKCKAPPAVAACKYNLWQARKKDPTTPAETVVADSNAPMTCVSHAQAGAFCAWKATLDGPGQGTVNAGPGTLPTEAQWEYAARGGCATLPKGDCGALMRPYAWGLLPWPATCKQAAVAAAGKQTCGLGEPGPIGAFPVDKGVHGLHDTVGGVREWVLDRYDGGFYATAAAGGKNPVNSGSGKDPRVVRGGSFKTAGSDGRLTARGKEAPGADTLVDVGFRCARPWN